MPIVCLIVSVSRTVPMTFFTEVLMTKRKNDKLARRESLRALLTVPEDAGRYLRAHKILTELREKYLAHRITPAQYSQIREQSLNGDIDGAFRALGSALEKNEYVGGW